MDRDQLRAVSSRIGARFPRRWQRGYVVSKLRSDPAFAAIAVLMEGRELPVLDVGCGMGLLAFFLRECGFEAEYLGLDLDPRKILTARQLAGDNASTQFREGNAAALPSFAGDVVLLDVLHYLSRADQQTLLTELAARVAPGGMLILRNVLRERGWRFRVTVIEEYLIHAMRWMRVGASYFPSREEIAEPLAAAGLALEIRPLWGNTPFNSYLIVARRPVD